MLPEVAGIDFDVLDIVPRHAPFDAATDSALLVLGKVVSGNGPQLQQDAVQAARCGRGHCLANSPGTHATQQHLRHCFHRQDISGVTGLDGADRHAIVFRRAGFLHERDAAGAENRAQSQSAVGSGTGEDDADGMLPLILGQGAQEGVNGHAVPTRLFRHRELQGAVEDGHIAIGRNHIDAVRRHHHAVLRLRHGHDSAALQDFGEKAGVAWIEVRHQYEGHADVARNLAEELLEGLETAGGRTQADDGETGGPRFSGFRLDRGGQALGSRFPGYFAGYHKLSGMHRSRLPLPGSF